MCGGRGTRLDAAVEKPLLEVAGVPMVDRVREALAASGVKTTYAVVSPNAPKTRAHIANDLPLVETPGEGYVDDLRRALSDVGQPVLTVAADLPLLDADVVDTVLDAFDGRSLVACVPAAVKRELGVSAETTFARDGRELAPTGVNVVADTDEESMYTTHDTRLAVNVNRLTDARVAEALLR